MPTRKVKTYSANGGEVTTYYAGGRAPLDKSEEMLEDDFFGKSYVLGRDSRGTNTRTAVEGKGLPCELTGEAKKLYEKYVCEEVEQQRKAERKRQNAMFEKLFEKLDRRIASLDSRIKKQDADRRKRVDALVKKIVTGDALKRRSK
jgi:hypothetical protein